MRILDRYILKSVLSVLLLCIGTFLFIYIVIDIFSYLEDIIKMHVPISTLIAYYINFLPVIFVQVAPFSCLMATLYTFASFNRNNEVIAMRAAGLSILDISKTAIILGFLVSLVVFVVNDRLVPAALSKNQKLKYQMEDKSKNNTKKNQEVISNLSMYGIGNRLFFVNKFSPATNSMDGIIILEQDENQNITRKIQANKGIYKNRIWTFFQSMTWDFDRFGMIRNEPRYEDEEMLPIPETPEEFLNQKQSAEHMDIAQLNDYIWKLSRSGATTVVRNLKVDLYQRYTSPLLSLIIILVGIPFSFIMRRRATGISSLGISIMVAFLYYVLNAVSVALGKGGVFPPLLSATFSHIVVFALSFYLIIKLP